MEAAEPHSTALQQTRVSASAPPSAAWSRQGILPAVALACALLSVWIVQHPYYGLVHDSEVYLIQALGRLNPDLFSGDIFLRYGSQDRFTLFGPVFAQSMRLFGIENAAVALSLLAHAGFFAAVTMLAGMLMPRRFVWPSIALICALPAFYGPGRIFAVVEDFATPRLFAETLVIVALVAFLRERFWLAILLGLGAIVLHPLMTVGGIVVALFSSNTPPRVRTWVLATGALAVAVLIGWMSAQGLQLRFDEVWLHLLQSGLKYLWISEWTLLTWSPELVSIITLMIGLLVLERSHARSLSGATLVAAVGGIALNYVAGDLLHVALVVQAQPYRCLWLSTLMSFLLLPLIVHRTWLRGTHGRSAALLLVAAWLCMSEPYGAGIAGLAFLASAGAVRSVDRLPERASKLILAGAWGVLSVAVVYHVATTLLFTAMQDSSDVPKILQDVRALSRSGVLPYTIFMVIYLSVCKFHSWIPRASIAAGCIAAVAALAPSSVYEWTTQRYGRDYQAFEDWRALIPPRTEVLWFDAPVATWVLLQRPNYLSNTQEVSGVFSRAAAMAMKHRVDMLEPYLSNIRGAAWLDDEPDEKEVVARANYSVPLGALCASAPDLRFIVTTRNMLAEPLATAPRGASRRYGAHKLYRCDQIHD